MPISFPLNLPTSPGLRRLELYTISAVAISRSPFSFVTQIQAHQGQVWGADCVLPPMQRAEAEQWQTFLLSLNGAEGTFYLSPPLQSTPRGIATGTPLVNGANQTGQTLITDGWTPSTTDILKAGDFIQVGQGLYKILTDTTSNGSGQATLDIFPRLRTSPSDNQAVITSQAKGLFRLADNKNSIVSVDSLQLYDFSFGAIEAI